MSLILCFLFEESVVVLVVVIVFVVVFFVSNLVNFLSGFRLFIILCKYCIFSFIIDESYIGVCLLGLL